MIEMTAKPGDREHFDVYVQDIETGHKQGPDGTLVAVDWITIAKKGTNNTAKVWDPKRLEKDDPKLWEFVKPTYEKWKQNNVIATSGTPIETWGVLSKQQIKLFKGLGLLSVEDLAAAGDGLREKLGMGGLDVIKSARSFLENKDRAAAANTISDLKDQLAGMQKMLEEVRRQNDELQAERGKKPQKPKLEREAA